MSGAVSAEARGKARRWLESLPSLDVLEAEADRAIKAGALQDIAKKKGVGRSRALARAASIMPSWEKPVVDSRRACWVVAARLQKLWRSDVAPGDPTMAAGFDRCASLTSLMVSPSGWVQEPHVAAISFHAVGRWFERISGHQDDIATGLLTLYAGLLTAGAAKIDRAVAHQHRRGDPVVPVSAHGVIWMCEMLEAPQAIKRDAGIVHEKRTAVFVRTVMHPDQISADLEQRLLVADAERAAA